MEIIKKYKESGKDMAWVRISETEAILMNVDKKTDEEIIEKAKKVVKLKKVQELINKKRYENL